MIRISIFFILFISYTTYSQWEECNEGIYWGNYLSSLCYFDNEMFIGSTFSGIYKRGAQNSKWDRIDSGLTNFQINKLYVANNILFACTNGGIFKLSDDKLYWIDCNNGIDSHYYYPIFNVVLAKDRLIASSYNGIFVSVNNGDNWKAVNIDESYSIFELFYYKDIIYALFAEFSNLGGQLMTSDDYGKTWKKDTNSFLQGMYKISALNNKIFVSGGAGIAYTTDLGKTWVDYKIYDKIQYFAPPYLLYTRNDTMFCFGNYHPQSTTIRKELYISNNGGTDWIKAPYAYNSPTYDKDINDILIINDSLFILPSQIYFNDPAISIVDLKTNGLSGLNGFMTANQTYSLCKSDNYLYAGGNNRIFISSNSGVSWLFSQVVTNWATQINSMITLNNSIFVATSNGILKNELNIFNKYWGDKIISNLPTGLLYDKNNVIYALSSQTNNPIVLRTKDFGVNWDTLKFQKNTYLNCIDVSDDNSTIMVGTSKGLFISNDYGANFIQDNILKSKWIFSIIKNRESDYYILSNNQMYKSSNNGNSWLKYDSALYHFGPEQGVIINDIFIGYGSMSKPGSMGGKTYIDGVYYKHIDSSNWIPFNEGLKGCSVYCFLVNNDEIFAGTNGFGLFKAKLPVLNNTKIVEPIEREYEVIITPNPAMDYLTISLQNNNAFLKVISIFNSLGEELKRIEGYYLKENNADNIPVSDLINGIYHCRLVIDGAIVTRSFVVIR